MDNPSNKEKKPGNKIGETLLGVLGAIGSVMGPLVTGRDVDFGLPFKLGSAYLQNERMNNDLMKALESNPHTAGMGEGLQSIIGQGGLPGLLNNLSGGQPQVPPIPSNVVDAAQGAPLSVNPPPSPVVETPILGDMGVGMTSGGMPVEAPPTPISDDYYRSPEFMQIMAKFRPDIATAAVTKRMEERPVDPLGQIMKLMALQNYMSPEQKAEMTQKNKFETMDYMDELISKRQSEQKQEAAQLSREKWSVGEQDFLRNTDFAINNSRLMLDKLNAGINPTVMTALLGKSPAATRAAMYLNPQLADQVQEYRDILKTVMTAVKTQSGVQYGFRELQWIKSSQPNEWDTPEMFKRGITQAMNTQLWNKYGVIIKKAERAGNAEVALREGMTPEQIKAWKVLDAQLAKRATSNAGELNVFADPQNKVLLDTLGMGMLPPVTSKKK